MHTMQSKFNACLLRQACRGLAEQGCLFPDEVDVWLKEVARLSDAVEAGDTAPNAAVFHQWRQRTRVQQIHMLLSVG